MKKRSLCFLVLALAATEKAAAQNETDIRPSINFLLRSSIEMPVGSSAGPTAAKLNEARFEIQGSVLPQLEYRIRYRLNRSHAGLALDNAPSSLDFAAVNYKFGKAQKYSLMVGKQAAMVGNWEFENNPTFEYQYSEHVNNQLNLFFMAAKLGYQANENHSFQVQVHNTVNRTFDELHKTTGFSRNNQEASKLPMGVYLIWRGDMFDKKWRTFWSYNVSQVAKGKTNHMASLGNRFVAGPVSGYLDLSYAYNPVDYFGVASTALNAVDSIGAFARKTHYTTGALRIDYNFAPKWYLTGKAFVDRSTGMAPTDFTRTNRGLLLGLEFKPFESEDMRIFGYYFNRDVRTEHAGLVRKENQGLVSVGVLYLVKAMSARK